jgi:peroxiredoxin
VVIVGAPAAFSPVCSRLHVPGFVDSVPSLLRSGYHQVVCVTPDNPWALQAWARQLDPAGQIRFLSDGNMKFGRALGLTTRLDSLFLGECFERFVLITKDCFVEKISVEESPLEVGCTSAAACAA